MIRTEALRVFVTVAECGNLKDATDRLFRTQSALSMTLKQLEDQLGAPLFEKSTRVLAHLSHLTNGKLPLIGVGGISTADEAYAKIRAGASAVQLYSALVYGGLSLVTDIARGLDALLARDGYASLTEATGTHRGIWL